MSIKARHRWCMAITYIGMIAPCITSAIADYWMPDYFTILFWASGVVGMITTVSGILIDP